MWNAEWKTQNANVLLGYRKRRGRQCETENGKAKNSKKNRETENAKREIQKRETETRNVERKTENANMKRECKTRMEGRR